MVLLALCVSGAVVAVPSMNVTISLTTTPQPPTDLDITQIGVASINITWTKGLGANITIVRGSTLGYPFSIFDGDAIYSGNGTWVQVDSLDLETYTYYYRAWSQNDYATSIGYDQATIGHGSGTSSNGTSTFSLTGFSLTGDGFGFVEMFLVVAILAISIWKKSWIRVVCSLAVIIWGTFAMQYDIKVAAPLVGIGTILFIMGIMRMVEQARAAREEA